MTRPPNDRDRQALISVLAAEARSTGTDGPEPEKLLDFLAGRLHPEEEERLSRYLMANPETSRALLDLADLEAAGAEAGKRPVELAAVAGWRDFKRRLPSPAPSPFRRFLQSWTLQPAALAAALLVSTLGLSTWVWRLQGELSRPVALQTLDLKINRGVTDTIALAPGARLHLRLHPTGVHCPVYTAKIEGLERGEPIEGLPPDAYGNLNLVLPRVEPGTYSLHLSGCQKELGNYRFRVTQNGG